MEESAGRDPQFAGEKRFLFVLLLVLLGFCLHLAQPFLWPVFSALMLAVAMYPLHAWLSRFIRHPGKAALASTLLTLLIVVGPMVAVTTAVTHEVTMLYQSLNEKSQQSGGWQAYFEKLVEGPSRWVEQKSPVKAPDMRQQIVGKLQEATGFVVDRTGRLVSSLTSLAASLLLSFVILYFFFRDGGRIVEFVTGQLPLSRERAKNFTDAIGAAITTNLYGVVAIAAVQGAMLGLGFWLLGLPSPALWGVIGIFLSMVPLVGPALVWLPAATVLFLQGPAWKGLLMVVWGALFVGMVDNVLRPIIVMRGAKLHPLLVLFSILGGTAAFGLMGLVLGPVIVAVTRVTLEALQKERQ
jgi:predicted PurR-regulated permease PerM